MNSTTGSEYTENIYMHLKVIFAFAAQSSVSKVHNDSAVRKRRTCTVPTCTQQHLCHMHKPVLGTHNSGTVPCRKTCTIRILYIDDAIFCIMNEVMHH